MLCRAIPLVKAINLKEHTHLCQLLDHKIGGEKGGGGGADSEGGERRERNSKHLPALLCPMSSFLVFETSVSQPSPFTEEVTHWIGLAFLQTSGLVDCGTPTEMGFKAFCSIPYLQCNNEYMKYSLYRVHVWAIIFYFICRYLCPAFTPENPPEPACKLGTETLKASFLLKAVHKADVAVAQSNRLV